MLTRCRQTQLKSMANGNGWQISPSLVYIEAQDLVSTMLREPVKYRVYSIVVWSIVRKDGKQVWLLEKIHKHKLGIES